MIVKLRSRGLIIQNEVAAIQTLKRVNYYRLSGDLLPYKVDEEKYSDGLSFEQLMELYEFDTRLRSHLLAIFEYIEISMRSRIAYHLAHKYGNECYNSAANFSFRSQDEYNNFN